MRDHTDFSQFYHTKCNFPKKSLDTSIPQFFSPNVAEIPNLGTNSPKVGSLCYSYETRHSVYYITVRSRTSSSSTNENQVYLCVPTEQRRLMVKHTRKTLHSPPKIVASGAILQHKIFFFKHKPTKSPQ